MKKQEYNIGYLLALLTILLPTLLGTVYEGVFNFYNIGSAYDGVLINNLSIMVMFSLAIAFFVTGVMFKKWTTNSDKVRRAYILIAVVNTIFIVAESLKSVFTNLIDLTSYFYWSEFFVIIGIPCALAFYLYFTGIKLVERLSVISISVGLTSFVIVSVAVLFN